MLTDKSTGEFMKIAFQMDPIDSVDINADSSFRLAEEAQLQRHLRRTHCDHAAGRRGPGQAVRQARP